MQELFKTYHKQFEWALGALVVVSALAVWFSNTKLDEGLTIYDIFPPLGLIAFGLMWTHFVMSALRRYYEVEVQTSVYKTASYGIVFGLILLHPLLLWIGLYRDGFGLPPVSHITAYENQVLAVGLGTIGLTIFLAFELRRWFSQKEWWRAVELAQIVGMAAIFYHAIELGSELRVDWFMALWWFYGTTLAVAIVYKEIIAKQKGQGNGKAVEQ